MTSKTLVVDGKVVALGKRIGKGGEGEVYSLSDDAKRALKLYTIADLKSREKKVAAMIKSGIATKTELVAFPSAIVSHENGRFAGFVMSLVTGHKPVHELYSPGARKVNFPEADYRFLVRAASNIAKAVASVHQVGCVIGDVNHSGILVSKKAMAALIDADSFQMTDGDNQYFCQVGVPEYTPPELQGQKLNNVVRTPNHDAFGLAVLLFQLLLMGRHPFVGQHSFGEMPMEKAISEYRFAYSRVRDVGMAPPPGAATLADLPIEVANAFETAFGDRSYIRPSAQAWIEILEKFEKALIRCSFNQLHHYSPSAQDCPWCRMENQVGMILFMPAGSSSANHSQNADVISDFEELWHRIEAIEKFSRADAVPIFPVKVYSASQEAVAAKKRVGFEKILGVGCCFAGLLLLNIAPVLAIVWIALAINGLFKVFIKPDVAEAFRKRYELIDNEFLKTLYQFQSRNQVGEFEMIQTRLLSAKKEYENLPSEHSARLADYQRNRREQHLNLYLEGFMISNSKIKGIGPAKTHALASYGIESAADVTESRVLAISGFGYGNSAGLFAWRKSLASKFVYNVNSSSMDKRLINNIDTEFWNKKAKLRSLFLAGPRDLKNAADKAKAMSRMPDQALTDLNDQREQLQCDLLYLEAAIPVSIARSYKVTINENYIRQYFGSSYASRGDVYQRAGKVKTATYNGGSRVCTGVVRGSRNPPYQLEVEISDKLDSITNTRCSCPIGNKCKHSAAVVFELIRNGDFT